MRDARQRDRHSMPERCDRPPRPCRVPCGTGRTAATIRHTDPDTSANAVERRERASRRRTRRASSCPRCRARSRARPPDAGARSRAGDGGHVGRTEADRLESLVDAALGVVRRPARRILEQPDRADAAIGAEIEPVMRAARHADQIAGLDFDREDRAARRMDVEQAAAFDDEADLVLVVPVLAIELARASRRDSACPASRR